RGVGGASDGRARRGLPRPGGAAAGGESRRDPRARPGAAARRRLPRQPRGLAEAGDAAGSGVAMKLKYGANPHQSFAEAVPLDPAQPPFQVLNGNPSYINLLDALNPWPLVREAKPATGLPAAASFKHVSPAGAALAVPLAAELARAYEVEGQSLTPAALAYVRARGADPKSSFGDFA